MSTSNNKVMKAFSDILQGPYKVGACTKKSGGIKSSLAKCIKEQWWWVVHMLAVLVIALLLSRSILISLLIMIVEAVVVFMIGYLM